MKIRWFSTGLPLSFKIWKSETAKSQKLEITVYTVVKEGKALIFLSHKEKLGVNDS